MDTHSALLDAVIYLSAAVIAVPISKRLGLGSVLGYLAAGIAIGPWGLGLIKDVQSIMHFAELGVVLLLFLIGLELNPRRLWQLRRPIVGMGGLQVLLTGGLIFSIAIALGADWRLSLVAAMGLALSSTAIALQILTEKNLLATPAGSSGFSILLFQDIAVIPMLAIMPLLGVAAAETTGETGWSGFLKVVAVIVFIIVGGRYLTRPVFRLIASARLREIFTAFSLLLVIGIALAMDSVGMSMALGTFLAGVLLAESEYRHQLEADIEPFKGLLLGLFFISVGMAVNFGLLGEQFVVVFGLVAGLITVKILVLFLISYLFKLPAGQRGLFSFLLSQGGEFAFVLFSVATSFSAIPQESAGLLVLVVAISMATTPLFLILNEKFIEPRFAKGSEPEDTEIDSGESGVIIAGFGRFGQIVGRVLFANRIPATVIDHNPDQIERVRRFGFKIFYGDVTRLDLLEAAGAHKAKLVILAIDDKDAALASLIILKEHFPKVSVMCRAWDQIHLYQLKEKGADYVIRETFESSLRMAEEVLKALDFSPFRAKRLANRFRHHNHSILDELVKVYGDQEKMISFSLQANEEVEKLFETDNEAFSDNKDRGWD
jgi:glutathione-regulated potassium-efflux system ancillary protein KefC